MVRERRRQGGPSERGTACPPRGRSSSGSGSRRTGSSMGDLLRHTSPRTAGQHGLPMIRVVLGYAMLLTASTAITAPVLAGEEARPPGRHPRRRGRADHPRGHQDGAAGRYHSPGAHRLSRLCRLLRQAGAHPAGPSPSTATGRRWKAPTRSIRQRGRKCRRDFSPTINCCRAWTTGSSSAGSSFGTAR